MPTQNKREKSKENTPKICAKTETRKEMHDVKNSKTEKTKETTLKLTSNQQFEKIQKAERASAFLPYTKGSSPHRMKVTLLNMANANTSNSASLNSAATTATAVSSHILNSPILNLKQNNTAAATTATVSAAMPSLTLPPPAILFQAPVIKPYRLLFDLAIKDSITLTDFSQADAVLQKFKWIYSQALQDKDWYMMYYCYVNSILLASRYAANSLYPASNINLCRAVNLLSDGAAAMRDMILLLKSNVFGYEQSSGFAGLARIVLETLRLDNTTALNFMERRSLNFNKNFANDESNKEMNKIDYPPRSHAGVLGTLIGGLKAINTVIQLMTNDLALIDRQTLVPVVAPIPVPAMNQSRLSKNN